MFTLLFHERKRMRRCCHGATVAAIRSVATTVVWYGFTNINYYSVDWYHTGRVDDFLCLCLRPTLTSFSHVSLQKYLVILHNPWLLVH